MGEHEVDRREPHEAVATSELVLAVGFLHHGDTGHQQNLDQQQDCGHQTAQPPDAGQTRTHVVQVLHATAGDPQGQDHQ